MSAPAEPVLAAQRRGAGVTLALPGRAAPLELAEPVPWVRPAGPARSRVAYAAAHVVPRVDADNTPGAPADVDWDATLAVRRDLFSWGLGVADAMDTAQRGMGLDWTATQELITRSSAEAAAAGARIACGAGTDQLDLASLPAGERGLALVIDAYREQVDVVRSAGATVILMASRALARVARGPQDYARVYATLLGEADQPVILHWLGTMFDPALSGYWGSGDLGEAAARVLDVIGAASDRVDGIKVSVLDADREVALRRALPSGVRLYTGDDYHYPDLVVGDDEGHSDALLGVFAAIAPAAAAALSALDAGDREAARGLLASTQELGRHVFAAPTPYYKTGIAFLAWLNGAQPGFQMVGGLHAGRSLSHLVQLLVLADRAGLLRDPDLAARRMRSLLHAWGAV